jgi:hypothetical protein
VYNRIENGVRAARPPKIFFDVETHDCASLFFMKKIADIFFD